MRLLRLGILLLFCTILASCGRSTLFPLNREATSKRTVTKQERQGTHAEMRRRLAASEYLDVLLLIDRQLRKGTDEVAFTREYPQAINGLLQQARQYYKVNRPSRAGKNFRRALEFYPSDPLVAEQVDMAPAQIEEALEGCSDALMEQGLLAYRAGRLDEAIDFWEKILAFSPSHQPAQKAIRTARIQLENLETLDSGPEK